MNNNNNYYYRVALSAASCYRFLHQIASIDYWISFNVKMNIYSYFEKIYWFDWLILLCGIEHCTGVNCETCLTSFYGDATVGAPTDCTPCHCLEPRVKVTNCSLTTGQPTCDCETGYTGPLCDRSVLAQLQTTTTFMYMSKSTSNSEKSCSSRSKRYSKNILHEVQVKSKHCTWSTLKSTFTDKKILNCLDCNTTL